MELEMGRSQRTHGGADAATAVNRSYSTLNTSSVADRRFGLINDAASRDKVSGGVSPTLECSSAASIKSGKKDEEDPLAGDISKVVVGENVTAVSILPVQPSDTSLVAKSTPSQQDENQPNNPVRNQGIDEVGETTCAMAPEHYAAVDTIGRGRQAVQ